MVTNGGSTCILRSWHIQSISPTTVLNVHSNLLCSCDLFQSETYLHTLRRTGMHGLWRTREEEVLIDKYTGGGPWWTYFCFGEGILIYIYSSFIKHFGQKKKQALFAQGVGFGFLRPRKTEAQKEQARWCLSYCGWRAITQQLRSWKASITCIHEDRHLKVRWPWKDSFIEALSTTLLHDLHGNHALITWASCYSSHLHLQ